MAAPVAPHPPWGRKLAPSPLQGSNCCWGRERGVLSPCPGYLPLTAGNPERTNERNRGSASPWQRAGCLVSKNGVRKCCRVTACHSLLPYKQPNHTSLLCRAELVTQPARWTRGPYCTWKDVYSVVISTRVCTHKPFKKDMPGYLHLMDFNVFHSKYYGLFCSEVIEKKQDSDFKRKASGHWLPHF